MEQNEEARVKSEDEVILDRNAMTDGLIQVK